MSIYKCHHYVYVYLRESDLTPYYVGKGKGNRYKSKKHNVNIPPKEENIVFVEKNLTNEEACELEIKLISMYGRKDLGTGILLNQTNGGDGGDTSKSENYQKWLNETARNKDSEYNKSQSKRMKEKNPLHNPEIVKKCHSATARKKRGLALRGTKKSEETKKSISKTLLLQSEEISVRQKKKWKDESYKEKTSSSMRTAINNRKNMTEAEFYIWIKSQRLFSYSKNIKRPNSRVKCIVDHFNKTEEFYGEYFKEIENKKKKTWEYYKDCPEKEFDEWLDTQKLFRKDGHPNPRILSVIKYRGLKEQYYQ